MTEDKAKEIASNIVNNTHVNLQSLTVIDRSYLEHKITHALREAWDAGYETARINLTSLSSIAASMAKRPRT